MAYTAADDDAITAWEDQWYPNIDVKTLTPAAASFHSIFTRERAAQARLIGDLFGNPFRPVAMNPSWHTPIVMGLAETIYQERAFDHLPILADALEDAGCTDADILNHCRQPGEHARGCWVIDLLTGRQ